MIYSIAYFTIVLSLALALVRLVRGPDAVDRIMAIDLMTTLLACLVVVHILATGELLFLDVPLAFAMIGFFGSLMYARYLQRRIKS